MIQHLVIILFLSLPNTWSHDLNLAIFNIHIEENKLSISIQFDQDDLEYVLSSETGRLVEGIDLVSSALPAYLIQNTQLRLNSSEAELLVESIKKEDDHYSVQCQELKLTEKLLNLEVINSCLINEIENHKNIIHIHQVDKEMRGFQMDVSRQKIEVVL